MAHAAVAGNGMSATLQGMLCRAPAQQTMLVQVYGRLP
jgi:hypothetical protein